MNRWWWIAMAFTFGAGFNHYIGSDAESWSLPSWVSYTLYGVTLVIMLSAAWSLLTLNRMVKDETQERASFRAGKEKLANMPEPQSVQVPDTEDAISILREALDYYEEHHSSEDREQVEANAELATHWLTDMEHLTQADSKPNHLDVAKRVAEKRV